MRTCANGTRNGLAPLKHGSWSRQALHNGPARAPMFAPFQTARYAFEKPDRGVPDGAI